MGERRRVRGTGRSEDMARVAETTARADTGHSSSTGSLRRGVIVILNCIISISRHQPVFLGGNNNCGENG